MSKRRKKQPRIGHRPQPTKTPHQVEGVDVSGLKVLWSFEVFDHQKKWYDEGYQEEPFREVAQHMRDYEGRTWGEILAHGKRDHFIPTKDLIPDAQARLRVINQDDIDHLLRFRFSGARRIWGIKKEQVFRVVWWDPQHRVCPSKEK
jgi:hypothetical protein